MRRKQYLFWLGLLVLVVGALATTLVLLLYHEPAFYQRVSVIQGPERKHVCTQLLIRLGKLGSYFADKNMSWKKKDIEEGWAFKFKEEEINSYFDEGFRTWGDAEMLRKRGITDPRLAVENDCIRLGFRYGTPPWSTVVSLDLRLWVVPKEVNVVALEILGRRAGALPISAQFFLDQVTEMARKSNIDVTWYRHNANPVALMRFQPDRIRPSAQLRGIELRPGMITIAARPLESAPIAFREPPSLLPTFHKLRQNNDNPLARLNPELIIHKSIYPLQPVADEQ